MSQQQQERPQAGSDPSRELLRMMSSLPPQIETLSAQDGGQQNVRSLTSQVRQLAEGVFQKLSVSPGSIPRSQFSEIWVGQITDPKAAELADQFTTFCQNPQQYTSVPESKVRMTLGTAAQELRAILVEHKVIARATASAAQYATAGQGHRGSHEARRDDQQ